MAAKFGTSGLRGLVTELTPETVSTHVAAFIRACPTGTGLYVGRDLRPSSPALADIVMRTAAGAGLEVTDCGDVPTPALALAAMRAGAAAVMVTGSHIPADRNGLKFYKPSGEISKADEVAILAALAEAPDLPAAVSPRSEREAGLVWVKRIVDAFGTGSLRGMKVGVWSHSAVSRGLLANALGMLGAATIELGRSDVFIPVDTEAVPQWARERIAKWVREHGLDALVSTDGDGDRPLVADETGRVVPGDVLGQIAAALAGAGTLVTPVSSNTGAERSGRFARVVRTKIGSPFVIAAMEEEGGDVFGYEANGGALLGFDAAGPAGPLPALATRDSLLPIAAALYEARRAGSLSARVAAEPARYTAADRLEDVPVEHSAQMVSTLSSGTATSAFLAALPETLHSADHTDGLRLICASGRIVHLRPSGNAPELRVYAEAESPQAAALLLDRALGRCRRMLQETGSAGRI